jgi:hypothetical protein
MVSDIEAPSALEMAKPVILALLQRLVRLASAWLNEK